MSFSLAFVTSEMLIPELGPVVSPALYRGGLGDLSGHVIEGLVKKGIPTIPITYGYPVDWKTGQTVDYRRSPAHFLFDLDVKIHYLSRTVPIFGIARAGTMAYLINDPEADVLYPGAVGEKIKQAAFLGKAAAALLEKLGVPDIVWSQEWMAAATLFPTLKDNPLFANTGYVFTLHTPSRAAMQTFSASWYNGLAIDPKYGKDYVCGDSVDPTLGCVRLADRVSAVSEEHGVVSRAMFPNVPIEGIMNGTSREFFLSPNIRGYPQPNERQLHMAHQADKRELIDLVRSRLGRAPNLDEPLIAAVRRLDSYKNQLPMLADYVAAICADRGERVGELRALGANVIIGGVAHEDNAPCREWMREFQNWMNDSRLKGRFFYIADYDANLRWKAAAGSDLWLVTPWPGWEACGTGDFVAKINGNVNIATWSGGIKEHGIEFNPETGTGDTLFIEPYDPRIMFAKLSRACDWFYQFRDHGDGPWSRLRMNAFTGGRLLDIVPMIEHYQERIFDPLLKQIAERPAAA